MTTNRAIRLTPANPLEQDIQSQIIAYLRSEKAPGRIAWFECGKGKVALSGALAGGQFFALEFKQHNEKPTYEQLEYLAAVREDGGIAAVVRSLNDAKNVLFGDGIKAVLAEEEINHVIT